MLPLLLLLLGAGTTAVYSGDGSDSASVLEEKLGAPGGGRGGSKPVQMLASDNVGRGLLGASTESVFCFLLCALRV
jgi:hypothetical protein